MQIMRVIHLLILLLFFSACKKDEIDVLPKATHDGKNTGGCLIDGKAFVAAGTKGNILSNGISPLEGGFAFDSAYYLELNGKYQGNSATVMLFIRSRKAGSHLLNKTTQFYPRGNPNQILSHATFYAADGNGVYVTDAQHTGRVELTHMNMPISAGTFEFTAVSIGNPGKTITITDGRFDRRQ